MASNFVEIFFRIWETARTQWNKNGPRKTFLQDFLSDLHEYGVIKMEDFLTVLILAVTFTIARYATTVLIFKPLAYHFQFITKDIQKLPESAWKLLYYCGSYGLCCYILFSGKYSFWESPDSIWIDWERGREVPGDIYALYTIQTGFYFHSIYATVFLDKWRRDSIVMILHHVLTIFLLVFSFTVRYHNIGLIVLFLHDIADILLESTKICVCFKSRPDGEHKVANALVNVGFLSFAFVWWFCRLYLYPYKVLYNTGATAVGVLPHGPFYFFFNGLLWMLFIMNIWWFHFVLWLIFRVMNGESREVEDVREISKEKQKRLLAEGGVYSNGINKGKKSQGYNPEQQNERKEKNGVSDKSKNFTHQRRKKNLQGN